MPILRTILPAAVLMALSGSRALAYQYPYAMPYPPGPYGYDPRFTSASYPYYPGAYRPLPPRHVTARPPESGNGGPAPATAEHDAGAVTAKPDTETDSAVLNPGKEAFITRLLPYIEQENSRLTALRRELASLFGKLARYGGLEAAEQQQISRLATKYRVSGDPLTDPAARQELLGKIDIIPVSLALAQAANESAWGQSRFAREANNLFGIWTYDEDKGLKPLNRAQGKTHLVRVFDDVDQSVRYYIYNLNSHPAYERLRAIRKQLRASGQVIDGHELAAGLRNYSAKGEVYIDLIRSLIRQNRWAQLDIASSQV